MSIILRIIVFLVIAAVSVIVAIVAFSGNSAPGPSPTPSPGPSPGRGEFPKFNGSHVQVLNDTGHDIFVWLDPEKPPCKPVSQSSAGPGNCTWANNDGKFFIQSPGEKLVKVEGNNKFLLKDQDVLVIETPTDENGMPEWYSDLASAGGSTRTRIGGGLWVTKTDGDLEKGDWVTRYEYYLNVTDDQKSINFDISAVDGNNSNGTMQYSSLDGKRKIAYSRSVLDTKDNNINGCDHATTVKTSKDGMDYDTKVKTCLSPKTYDIAHISHNCGGLSEELIDSNKLDVAPNPEHPDTILTPARNTTAVLSGCSQDGTGFTSAEYACACRLWWANNTCARSWCNYLQGDNRSTIYCWPYDEKLLRNETVCLNPSEVDGVEIYTKENSLHPDIFALPDPKVNGVPASNNMNITITKVM